jgi:prepilin signal peptidase PulO-like enzyme (type II secretory pathway)
MIIAITVILGLCAGSFINALVWRIHAQETSRKQTLVDKRRLSITKGRSICPHCKHQLASTDLIPIFSWLWLRGKCRYCHKSISIQYPLVELATTALFVASYAFWPIELDLNGSINFVAWLIILTGFIALLIYDLRWMILPNRVVYPMISLAVLLAIYNIISDGGFSFLFNTIFAVAIAGGLFYLLFMISKGRWIGGGDVKLGALIGLLLADPFQAFLMLMAASMLGTLVVLPGLALKKLTPSSRIPFGPFLIVSAIVVKLFGAAAIAWYKRTVLLSV